MRRKGKSALADRDVWFDWAIRGCGRNEGIAVLAAFEEIERVAAPSAAAVLTPQTTWSVRKLAHALSQLCLIAELDRLSDLANVLMENAFLGSLGGFDDKLVVTLIIHIRRRVVLTVGVE